MQFRPACQAVGASHVVTIIDTIILILIPLVIIKLGTLQHQEMINQSGSNQCHAVLCYADSKQKSIGDLR